jgi:phosphoserine aminotransferase
MLKEQGGVAAMQKINERKAAILYEFLIKSGCLKHSGTASPLADGMFRCDDSEELNKELLRSRKVQDLSTSKDIGWLVGCGPASIMQCRRKV